LQIDFRPQPRRQAAGFGSGGDNWGTAVVGLDGSIEVLQAEPNATFVDVLP
jgi:hypothetical protein